MSGKLFFKKLITGAIFGWLILSGSAVESAAGTSTKAFDFGAGGDNPTFCSHWRTFAAPDDVAIVVAANYRATGEAGAAIIVEYKFTG